MKANTHLNMNSSLRQKLSSLKPKKTMVQENQSLQQSETKSNSMATPPKKSAPKMKSPKMENNATVPGVNQPLEKIDRQPVPKKKLDIGSAPANVGQSIPKAAPPEFAAGAATVAPAAAPKKTVKMKATKAPAAQIAKPAAIVAKPAKVNKAPAVKVTSVAPKGAATVKQVKGNTDAHHAIKAKLGTKKAIGVLKEKALASSSTEGKLANSKKLRTARAASVKEKPKAPPTKSAPTPAPTASGPAKTERPATLPTKSLEATVTVTAKPQVKSGNASWAPGLKESTAPSRSNVDASKVPPEATAKDPSIAQRMRSKETTVPEATAKDPLMAQKMRAQETTVPEKTADPTPEQIRAGEVTAREKTKTMTRTVKDDSIARKMAAVHKQHQKTIEPSTQDVNKKGFGVINFLRSYFNTKSTANKVSSANYAAHAKSETDNLEELKKKDLK